MVLRRLRVSITAAALAVIVARGSQLAEQKKEQAVEAKLCDVAQTATDRKAREPWRRPAAHMTTFREREGRRHLGFRCLAQRPRCV